MHRDVSEILERHATLFAREMLELGCTMQQFDKTTAKILLEVADHEQAEGARQMVKLARQKFAANWN
jgi:hypothetical protein